MNQFVLVTTDDRSNLDEAMFHLAEWMGLAPVFVPAPTPPAPLLPSFRSTEPSPLRMGMSADTLAWLLDYSPASTPLIRLLTEEPAQCLIYGFRNCPKHVSALRTVTGLAAAGITSIPSGPHHLTFSSSRKQWLQQLTGLDFIETIDQPCDAFVLSTAPPENERQPLLSVEHNPIFLHTARPNGLDLFLWATDRIADVNTTIPSETPFESQYRWFLPAMIYLKACFGRSCWHNPSPRARLIIDDPLLQPRYGFLRYDELIASMQRTPYATSLAFIPWNYRRSDNAVANMFTDSQGRLSLCVHGCDHTNHEFDTSDEGELSGKAVLALQLMEEHQKRSGVPYEKIMVFPQGHFSVPAISALHRSGYLAAINSTCYPNQGGLALSLGDLLRPAMCHLYGFPIFPRRDPLRSIDVAVDLFVGKAGFIVEHHEFVRDGFSKWERFAEQMNHLDERLTWPNLVETLTETCLQRIAGPDRLEVRFLTHAFRWHNPTDRPVDLHLSKTEPAPTLIADIRINGEHCPFRFQNGLVHVECPVAPHATIEVTVQHHATRLSPFKPSFDHTIRVGLRRFLSELRDNQLAQHPHLLGVAKGIVRQLGLTSESARSRQ